MEGEKKCAAGAVRVRLTHRVRFRGPAHTAVSGRLAIALGFPDGEVMVAGISGLKDDAQRRERQAGGRAQATLVGTLSTDSDGGRTG